MCDQPAPDSLRREQAHMRCTGALRFVIAALPEFHHIGVPEEDLACLLSLVEDELLLAAPQ
jgi:hypothetical protein